MLSCFPDMYSTILAPTDRTAAARFFRVLGDPTRLHILELLEEQERTVGEIVNAVGQPQPRVSTHLACLRHCGFVTTERRGKEVFYRLAPGGLGPNLGRGAPTQAARSRRLGDRPPNRPGVGWMDGRERGAG